MGSWKRVVYQAVGAAVGLQVLMNVLYLLIPFTLTVVEFNLVVLSADTSFLALYYGIRAYVYAASATERVVGSAKELMGTSFVESLIAVGRKLEAKYRGLTPEQKERLAKLLDRAADFGFDRLIDLVEGGPKRRPKRITIETALVQAEGVKEDQKRKKEVIKGWSGTM
jgi:hypothetical protein